MPSYYKGEAGKQNKVNVEVRPKEWWRLPFLRRLLPYFAYKTIKLRIIIRIPEDYETALWKNWRIWELLPARKTTKNKWIPVKNEQNKKVEIDFETTYPVSQEGDVEIRLCGLSDIDNGTTLFSCRTISTDRIITQVVIGLILAGFAFLLGKFG